MNVCVGMNTDGTVQSRTMLSLTRIFNEYPDDFQSRLILLDGGCADFAGSRNKLVSAFLRTNIDWLLIVDADMVFTPDDWMLLKQSVSVESRPWVSGLYFVDGDKLRPCAMVMDAEQRAASPIIGETDGLMRVNAAGLGFALVHRSVFQVTQDVTSDHPWFAHGWTTERGETMPEDYAFAARCDAQNIPVYLNCNVRLGHIKSHVVGWAQYSEQQARGKVVA